MIAGYELLKAGLKNGEQSYVSRPDAGLSVVRLRANDIPR
jgi:hypothetical protein